MEDYEAKSSIELRLEDYVANRKGPEAGTVQTGGLFGTTPQKYKHFFGISYPATINGPIQCTTDGKHIRRIWCQYEYIWSSGACIRCAESNGEFVQ